MKRFCKKVDITDLAFIENAVFECLNRLCKRKRHDTVNLFASVAGCSKNAAAKSLVARDDLYVDTALKIAKLMQGELIERKLTLPPINVKYKLDGDSRKVRKISVQHIRQLLFDHVAVMAMDELNRLMGEHQVSGRKGLGASAGQKFVQKWVSGTQKRLYFTKLDIKHYYESVDTTRIMAWLRKHVKNEPLLWLVETLLNTGEPGLNIGSYLSHFLANLYLSDAWHFAMQQLPGIKHALFYMDAMLLLGHNKRKLGKSAAALKEYIEKNKGLTIKDTWQVHQCSLLRPIDIIGVRFTHDRATLRKRIFRKARRSFIRLGRFVRKHKWGSEKLARRVTSYNGWLLRTNCKSLLRKLDASTILHAAGSIIRKSQTNDYQRTNG